MRVTEARVFKGQLSTDQRPQPGLPDGLIEARCAVYAITVAERDSVITQDCGRFRQFLRSGGTFEKAESTARAQFNVCRNHFGQCLFA